MILLSTQYFIGKMVFFLCLLFSCQPLLSISTSEDREMGLLAY